jgi:hypothetical protein
MPPKGRFLAESKSSTFEIRDVAGRDRSPVAEGDGGNLRIKVRDRASDPPAFGGNAGVRPCGIAAKGENAIGKVCRRALVCSSSLRIVMRTDSNACRSGSRAGGQ